MVKVERNEHQMKKSRSCRIKLVSLLLSLIISALPFALTAHADSPESDLPEEKSVTDYTYKITPLLEPFNEYFFVETDNPDPLSFRFVDKDSVYVDKNDYDKENGSTPDDAVIKLDYDNWNNTVMLYADVNYDDPATGRVNGGYIFYSFNTDGGEVVLQKTIPGEYSWNDEWADTEVKLTLPAVKDVVDYLIDTYAVESDFFKNMESIESGFSSICLYSGSNIRGDLVKNEAYWSAAIAFHQDQKLYIYSPYDRTSSKSLFASDIYPFRYDSLGFPSVLYSTAKRLDNTCAVKWDDYLHYMINITYNGETRSFGGQGNGSGQAVTEDKILKYFTFGGNNTKLTLEESRKLLDDYSNIKMSDDIPRQDALTWEKIFHQAGNGTWAKLRGNNFVYFYQNGDGDYFWGDEWGVGNNIYWGGDLEYASDAWVDGRYVSAKGAFIQNAKFEEHPTSSIILDSVMIPQIDYDLVYEYTDNEKYTKHYDVNDIKVTKQRASFSYDEENQIWTADYNCFDSNRASYNDIHEMVNQGLINEKYLDMVMLTADEVKALNVDRNTNVYPQSGYVYNGSVEPGTHSDLLDYVLSGWEWDGTDKAEATFTSLNDETKKITVNAVLNVERTEPTCEEYGEINVTARAEFDGGVFYDHNYALIEYIGHKYKPVSWKWDGFDSAEVTLVCENDDSHTTTLSAWIYCDEVTDPTCEKDGSITYIAEAYYYGDTFTDTKTEILPKTGHKYRLEYWNWDGIEKAEASFICENCWLDTKTIDANITYEIQDDDTALYIAEVTFDGEKYTDTVIGIAPGSNDSDSDIKTHTDADTDLDPVTHDNLDTDTSSDTEIDTEIDTDTSTETSDISTDIDSETDTESDSATAEETDTESDTDTATDTETDSDTESDTATAADTETDSDLESDTDTATDTETDSDTESDTDTATDTETDSDTESDTDTAADTETDSDLESDTDTATDTETDSDTESDTEDDSKSDSDTDTDSDPLPDEPKQTAAYGDLDGDGKITSGDALMILRQSVGMESFTPEQITLADVDGDGKITAGDALAVLRRSVGMNDDNNVGKPIQA